MAQGPENAPPGSATREDDVATTSAAGAQDAESDAGAALAEKMAEVERALSSAGSLSHLAWTAVEGLEMPTAMHAHSAITVPLLPQANWSQPVGESDVHPVGPGGC